LVDAIANISFIVVSDPRVKSLLGDRDLRKAPLNELSHAYIAKAVMTWSLQGPYTPMSLRGPEGREFVEGHEEVHPLHIPGDPGNPAMDAARTQFTPMNMDQIRALLEVSGLPFESARILAADFLYNHQLKLYGPFDPHHPGLPTMHIPNPSGPPILTGCFRSTPAKYKDAKAAKLRKFHANGFISPVERKQLINICPFLIRDKGLSATGEWRGIRLAYDASELSQRLPHYPQAMADRHEFYKFCGPFSWCSDADWVDFYHSILLDLVSRGLFGFVWEESPTGFGQWNVLPQGLLQAGVTSAVAVARHLWAPLISHWAATRPGAHSGRSYVDNSLLLTLLLHLSDEESLLIHLRDCLFPFMLRSAELGMRFKPNSGPLAAKRSTQLGYTSDGVRLALDPQRVAGFVDMVVSTSISLEYVEHVRGLFQAYQHMVATWQYNDDLRLFTTMITTAKRDGTLCKHLWKQCHTDAFIRLRDAVVNSITLYLPDYNLPFYLLSDASLVGYCAELFQFVDGVRRTVAITLKRFTPAQQGYDVQEREFFSIVDALRWLRKARLPHLGLFIFTDHKNLLSLASSPHPQMRKYLHELLLAQAVFSHRQGKHMQPVDNGSRIATLTPVETPLPPIHIVVRSATLNSTYNAASLLHAAYSDEPEPPAPTAAAATTVAALGDTPVSQNVADTAASPWIRAVTTRAQLKSPTGGPLTQAHTATVVHNNPTVWKDFPMPTLYAEILLAQAAIPPSSLEDITTKHGLRTRSLHPYAEGTALYKGERIFIPSSATATISAVLHRAHEGMGHGGITDTENRCDAVWWPSKRVDIQHHVASCMNCQLERMGSHNAPSSTPWIQQPPAPYMRLILDHMPMGDDAILTVTDCATRFTWAIIVPDLSADTTLTCYIDSYVVLHGHPLELYFDNHGSFKADFATYCKAHGTLLHTGRSYHPQGQARGERPHQNIMRKLRASLPANSHNWRPILQHVMQAVNSAKHSALGVSPYEALFGRVPRTDAAASMDLTSPLGTLAQHKDMLEYMHLLVHECELKHNIVQQDYLAEAMAREGHMPHTFSPGDHVALFFPDRADKTHYHYVPGYRIHSISPKPGVYTVEELDPTGAATIIGDVSTRRLMPITVRAGSTTNASILKEDHHVIESILGHLVHPVPPGSPAGTTPTVTFSVRWAAGPQHDHQHPRLGDLMRNCKHLLDPYLLQNKDIKHHWLTKQRAAENKKDKESMPTTITEAFPTLTPPVTAPPVAGPPLGPHPGTPAPRAAPIAAPGLIQPQ
jgi:hypothetical protein